MLTSMMDKVCVFRRVSGVYMYCTVKFNLPSLTTFVRLSHPLLVNHQNGVNTSVSDKKVRSKDEVAALDSGEDPAVEEVATGSTLSTSTGRGKRA